MVLSFLRLGGYYFSFLNGATHAVLHNAHPCKKNTKGDWPIVRGIYWIAVAIDDDTEHSDFNIPSTTAGSRRVFSSIEMETTATPPRTICARLKNKPQKKPAGLIPLVQQQTSKAQVYNNNRVGRHNRKQVDCAHSEFLTEWRLILCCCTRVRCSCFRLKILKKSFGWPPPPPNLSIVLY